MPAEFLPVPPSDLGDRVPHGHRELGHRAVITLDGFTLASVADARRFVSDSATAWAIPREQARDLVQIVSELAANAVDHSPGLRMTVTASLGPGAATVSVTDGGPTQPLNAKAAADDDERGRGLAIVDVLADQWGQMTENHGTRVWARVAIPAHDLPGRHARSDAMTTGTTRATEHQLTAYRCTVVAEKPVDGHDIVDRAELGEANVPTSKLSVRWPCDQAALLADGLDAGYDRSYYAADPDPMGNVAARLRAWTQNDAEQRLARTQLVAYGRLRLVFRGAAGRCYLLSAHSLAQPVPPAPTVPSEGTGLRRPRHRRAGRPRPSRRIPAG